MSAAALSIFVFGIYLIAIGFGFFTIPNVILPIFKFPKSNESWIRVLGWIVVVLGFYYVVASQNELTEFYRATIYGRFGILVGFSSLVLMKKAKPMLILFGLVDAAGAIWTLLSMS